MLERRKIIELWKNERLQRAGGALVTLVGAVGSSYRRPGARLLTVFGDTQVAGTISGGCLEADVVRRAAWITRDGAAVERYSMAFDDTAEIPFGLGCGGTVDLLFEPLNTPEGDALLEAMEASLDGVESSVTTYLPEGSAPLRRVIWSEGGLRFRSVGLGAGDVGSEVETGQFVEVLESPQRLFVMGAGEDARPIVELAALLGWTVTVADGRRQLARRERFPGAARVVGLSPAEVGELGIGERDAVVLVTHSYEQDRELLTRILPLRPRYLGLLGSRHRSGLLVAESAAMLRWSVEACCERLFAPVGLDIGGDGPEAIALAVIAEVQSVRYGRIGSQRRMSAVEVAEQVELGGSSLFLRAQCALSE